MFPIVLRIKAKIAELEQPAQVFGMIGVSQ
jgi:hypothetical protein